jgi:DNA-directed RNA polymerase specialized sigma24 family protein
MKATRPTARPVFVARCTRSGEWWAVSVDDAEGVHLRGANTQAKRLDQVEAVVREVVSILLDVDEDSFDVLLEVDLPGRLKEEISLARTLREQAETVQREATAATARAAVDLVKSERLTIREAARLLGLSHQRVDQLLERAEPPLEKAPA